MEKNTHWYAVNIDRTQELKMGNTFEMIIHKLYDRDCDDSDTNYRQGP